MKDDSREQIFAIVRNEDQAKQDAQNAIEESDLSVGQSEVFYAHSVFNHKEEVRETIFGPFDHSGLVQKEPMRLDAAAIILKGKGGIRHDESHRTLRPSEEP